MSNKWLALTGVGFGALMLTLDTSIVNIALPTITQDLETSFALVQWVILSYVLVINILSLSVARLSDILDKKRLFLAGLIIFTCGSFLCSLSINIWSLIGFRALQGFGSVLMSAIVFAIVIEIFPPTQHGQVLGIMAGIFTTGFALGPTVGGFLVSFIGWRSIFWVNLPVGILAIYLVFRFIPPIAHHSSVREKFDIWGAITFGISMGAFSLAMTNAQNHGFTNESFLILMAIAIISIGSFLWLESHIPQPMLELFLFRNLQLSLSFSLRLLVFFVFATSQFLIPFFLDLVKNYPSNLIGLLMATGSISTGLLSPIGGKISDKIGAKIVMVIGLTLLTLAALNISYFDSQITRIRFILSYLVFGIGAGLFNAPSNNALMNSVPKERLGIASSLASLSTTLAQSIAIPVMSTLFMSIARNSSPANATFTSISQLPPMAIVSGFQGVFKIGTLMILTCLIMAFFDWWKQRQLKVS